MKLAISSKFYGIIEEVMRFKETEKEIHRYRGNPDGWIEN